MNEDNTKSRNINKVGTTGTILQIGAIAVIVFGVFVASVVALVGGILEGTPPSSEHNKKLPVNKSESVSVVADASGNATEVTDTVYITNNPEHKILKDKSLLTSVTNNKQKSNLPERIDKDSTLVWSAKGYDVSYKGEAKPSDLPITMSVKYYFNNVEINPDNLEGKTGKLKIVINYNNNIKTTLDDGSEIVVPYAVTSILISGTDMTKIKCTTGTGIKIGGNEYAMGVNIPGLQELSGSKLFGVGTNETIFTANIKDFKQAQIISLVTGDLVANLDTNKLGNYDIDSLVIKVGSLANKAIVTLDKYAPYLDVVNNYVPKVMDTSSKARTTTNKVMKKIIDFLKRMDDSYNTVEGASNLYESLIDKFYEQIFGTSTTTDGDEDSDSSSSTDSSATTTKPVEDTVDEMGKAITGYEKKKENSEETEHVNGVVDELGETLPILEKAKEAAQATADSATDDKTKTEAQQDVANCEKQIEDICDSILELDPDSEYLENYLTPEQKAKRNNSSSKGLIDEYNETMSILDLYEKIYNDPTFVEQYFTESKTELNNKKSNLEAKIAAEADADKKAKLEEKLAKVDKDLDELITYEKKAKKDDGKYYSLKELQKMGGSAKDVVAYIIDQLITPEQKDAIIAKLEKANSFVNKTDNLIQKYGKKVPGLVKKLKNLKSKIDKIYYKKFLKYLGIYDDDLKGTAKALEKTIEAHKKVANFSGLSDGWTGTTTYKFTVAIGKDAGVLDIIKDGTKNNGKDKD